MLNTLIIFIATWILHHLLKFTITKAVYRLNKSGRGSAARIETLASVLKNSIKYILWSVAVILILAQWQINLTPVFAGAGVFGLAVGFGAQTMVKDVITGFFLLFENFLNIGDHVKIAGLEGKVVSVKLRTTILRDKDGTTHIIPNSLITSITKLA